MRSSEGRENFLGVDLSFPQKPSACVVIGGGKSELKCLFSGFLSSDDEIIGLAKIHRAKIVAIDAPLALPRGLCCLEEGCDCVGEGLRSAEMALARLGFPCFFTTKKSIIKPLVYRGIALRKRLEEIGFRVIEVYPYATRKILWGRHPPKSRMEGVAFLERKLNKLFPIKISGSHHLIDAALAAYTAFLHCSGKTITLGRPDDGEIIIPHL